MTADPPTKFNRLQPLGFHSLKKYGGVNRKLWEFQCDCGQRTVAVLSAVMSGHTKSCGCLALEFKEKHRESNAVFIRNA